MSSVDDFDLDERTPVVDIADPKRTALEAEVQIARAAHQAVRAEWEKSQQAIAAQAVAHRREIAELKARHREEMRVLELANLKLREGKK